MDRVALALERAYGTPELGNLLDPLDEAAFIILTYQTDVGRARLVWTELRARFPTWNDLLAAPVQEVERVLQPGGFQRARAKLIRAMLLAVAARWGQLSLAALRALETPAAEAELRALPGLDIKGARCVLLYSLARPVLPVDSNAFRFMQRYGVIGPGARYRRVSTHDELQALVEPRRRHALHVNLVVHGQRTCVPRTPRCGECPIRRSCATGRLAAASPSATPSRRAPRDQLQSPENNNAREHQNREPQFFGESGQGRAAPPGDTLLGSLGRVLNEPLLEPA